MQAKTHPALAEKAQTRLVALRYWLMGRGYHQALRALEENRRLFPEFRKDGVTPAFDHHVYQALFARTLEPHFLFKEEVFAAIFFHDTMEDKPEWGKPEVLSFFLSHPDPSRSPLELERFGHRVADASWRVTKKHRGTVRDEEALFEAMSECPIASLVKGFDRIHNVLTMVGVFTPEKQERYLDEVERLFLPMLKKAKQRFPEQEGAYENIRNHLKTQVALIRGGLVVPK